MSRKGGGGSANGDIQYGQLRREGNEEEKRKQGDERGQTG